MYLQKVLGYMVKNEKQIVFLKSTHKVFDNKFSCKFKLKGLNDVRGLHCC